MKKIRLLVILFIMTIFYKQTNAQSYHTFPNDSAQWSVGRSIYNPWIDFVYQLKMKGDTILNGINYKKIYYSNHLAYNYPDDVLHCFLREDGNKKIWVKYPFGSLNDTSEKVLYDFNIHKNDTIGIHFLYFNHDSIIKLIVRDTLLYQTNIDIRKAYYFNPVDSVQGIFGIGCMWWLEGIGSSLGLFYNEILQWGCYDSTYTLQCYSHNGTYFIGGNLFCTTEGIFEDKANTNVFAINPNPVNYESILDVSELKTDIMSIEVFNYLGVKIRNLSINMNDKIIIRKSNFQTGYYFFRIIDKKGDIYNGKFIII
jgi:hypothetical protein